MNGLKPLNKYSINVRTLKDIGFNPHGQDMAFPDYVGELRNAAKEWVLGLQESIGDSTGDYTDVENIEREAQIEWIETFFNLEDENE